MERHVLDAGLLLRGLYRTHRADRHRIYLGMDCNRSAYRPVAMDPRSPMKRPLSYWHFLSFFILFLGAGCVNPPWSRGTQDPTSLTREEKNRNAEQADIFAGGRVEIRQTLFGLGGSMTELLGSSSGVRSVRIESFEPQRTASIRWSLVTRRETDASKKARAEYEVMLRNGITTGTTPLPPAPLFEPFTTTGTMRDLSLASGHVADLPGAWIAGDRSEPESGAMWLSSDAYQELEKTGKTVLHIRSLKAPERVLDRIDELQSAWGAIQNAERAEIGRTDPSLMVAEPEPVDYLLEVDGRAQWVSAMRAQHWFGSVYVLRNPENPLILSFDLHPLKGAASLLTGQSELLQKLFGYEIRSLITR